MNNPVVGIGYFIDGFSLIAKPGIKRFVIIPLTINIVFFIGLFFVLRYYLGQFNHWFGGFLPDWLQWLSAILWVIFLICFILVFFFTFTTVANIISAPFNSFLSEKVEWYLTGKAPEDRSLLDNLKDIPRIVGRQFAILGYYLPRVIMLGILFFIPFLQVAAPILWFLFSAWFLTMTFIDYPTDNHRLPLRDVKTWLKERRWTSLGFGIGVLVSTMVPILNFFTIPAAVAGGTKFWLQEAGKKA